MSDEDETRTACSESTALRSSYDNDRTKTAGTRRFVPVCGLVFYTAAFVSLLCQFAQVASLSVAIVAMVNHTAVGDDVVATNATGDQCPRDAALRREDGELVWDRHEQGAALATFYYGYVITQVCSSRISTTLTRNFNQKFSRLSCCIVVIR